MRSFDHKEMKDAAWGRFERRIRRGEDEEEARRTWTKEAMAIDGIARVAEWLKGRGITIRFERREGAAFHETSKAIIVAGTMRPDAALVYILHECGHVLIGSDKDTTRYALGYPRSDDPEVNKSFQHRLAILEEETEAWHRGWKLMHRLKIGWCVDEKHWEETRQRCLKSYVKWSLTPHKFLEKR